MYQNQMQMHDAKASNVPRVFRETIVQQLQQEMSRCGGIGKSPVEVEQYIYDSIHSKEEYLEKIGKIILGLQQKQQQQQQPPQQTMAGPGQVQYGVRQFQPGMQGQYVYQHPQQGQQPTAVLIHTGQGQVAPAQIIGQQRFNVRQLPPGATEHVVAMQGQPQFRPAPRPSVMQQQAQLAAHPGQVISQPRQQFPPGQTVLMAQQPQQPNIVMGPTSNIVLGTRVPQPAAQPRRPQHRPAPEQPPQQQIVYSTKVEQQQQQQQYPGQQQHQQQQPQSQMQQQQAMMQQQQMQNSVPPQGQQVLAALQQTQPQPQQFAPSVHQPQPQTALTRQSRSFNTGIASPAVSVPPPTGPSPLGPKGGPGSVHNAMSPAVPVLPPQPQPPMGQPQQQPMPMPPQQSQPMPVTVAPPVEPPPESNQMQQDTKPVVPPPNVTAQATPEEIAEKLKQLAKYKEPLRYLIETFEGHKDNASTMNKMKRILDIISGQGCESMTILRKCEEACIQVVNRYCPEPSVNQLFSNALAKVAMASDSIGAQQQIAKSSADAFSMIASKAFGSVFIDSNKLDLTDLGPEWNTRLIEQSAASCRAVPDMKSSSSAMETTPEPIYREFAHLSRAAQRELLFLSEKYAISCRASGSGAGVPTENGGDADDVVAVDFVPTSRCLLDAGAPSICMLISPDYPDSPDVPQVVFSPASELNDRLAAIKRKFVQMFESVKVSSVSDVSIIRLITFLEASVLSESA